MREKYTSYYEKININMRKVRKILKENGQLEEFKVEE